MSGIKEELVRGLTPRSLVISVSLLIISIIIGDIQWLYSEKPWVFHGWFVPFVYIILINEVLGRINKRLRLTSQELLVIFPSMFFAAGKNYVLAGITAGEIIFSELHWNLELTAFALNIGDLRDVFAELTPWFMFPTGPEGMEIARIIQEGLKPGEALNWGLLTVPILYWSAVMVLMFFIMQFLVFAIVGQPWTEVERLVFPMAVPYMYTINRAGDVDPATNKSRLFDLKDPRMKVFWAGLIVGILLTAIPALYEVFPPLAILEAFQWGETPVRFEPLVAALPGARGWACLIIAQALLWLLLPNEVYYTSIAMWIVFGVLYQWLGVMTGVIAYEPGMEYRWPWEAVPQWWAPLPYGLIATTGIMLGIGAWNLWFLRSRIKRLASVFKGGEDIVEHGLSMRFMTRFGVASILLFLILMVVTGVPVVIAVIFLALWFLWLVQVTRCWSEIWWHEGNFAVQGNIWNYYHNIGAAMGYWPMEATWEVPNMSYAWYATNRITFATSTWVVRHYPMGEGNLALLYKMAHYNKLDLKDLFTITLIIGVVGSVFATIWQIWML
ncbi:TPA: hypothetical protein EYP44_01215, partial [Candidatus Bathyarchaeota archaeon]|nr:hypothetical protein [Candidatus Bathyarchaeota archaeon]